MRKHRIGFVVVVVTVFTFAVGSGLAQLRQRATNVFMRQKLEYAQGVLEGVTLEKYELVVTNATLLRNMSITNAFLRLDMPDYRRAIANFQVTVDNLVNAAQQKDQVKTTEEYAALARNCVQCHKQFRREQAGPPVK